MTTYRAVKRKQGWAIRRECQVHPMRPLWIPGVQYGERDAPGAFCATRHVDDPVIEGQDLLGFWRTKKLAERMIAKMETK